MSESESSTTLSASQESADLVDMQGRNTMLEGGMDPAAAEHEGSLDINGGVNNADEQQRQIDLSLERQIGEAKLAADRSYLAYFNHFMANGQKDPSETHVILTELRAEYLTLAKLSGLEDPESWVESEMREMQATLGTIRDARRVAAMEAQGGSLDEEAEEFKDYESINERFETEIKERFDTKKELLLKRVVGSSYDNYFAIEEFMDSLTQEEIDYFAAGTYRADSLRAREEARARVVREIRADIQELIDDINQANSPRSPASMRMDTSQEDKLSHIHEIQDLQTTFGLDRDAAAALAAAEWDVARHGDDNTTFILPHGRTETVKSGDIRLLRAKDDLHIRQHNSNTGEDLPIDEELERLVEVDSEAPMLDEAQVQRYGNSTVAPQPLNSDRMPDHPIKSGIKSFLGKVLGPKIPPLPHVNEKLLPRSERERLDYRIQDLGEVVSRKGYDKLLFAAGHDDLRRYMEDLKERYGA